VGGRLSYRCDLDVEHFREIACDRAPAFSSITKSGLRQPAYDLREKRRQFGINFLVALDCPGLVPKLKDTHPSAFPDDDTVIEGGPYLGLLHFVFNTICKRLKKSTSPRCLFNNP
jgi:hypothetical protein